jgi:hypothetical protein
MTNYKNSFRNALAALLLGGAMLCAACKKDEPKSAACDIVSFSVNDDEWNISGTDITRIYPAGTEATILTPAITLSPGASVNPPSGIAQNFFGYGVTYTVTAEDGVTTKTYVAKVTFHATGATGDCTWTLTGVTRNYTLTISGNGAMENYIYNYNNDNDRAPWFQYSANIKTAVIQDGVTTIGNYAFSGCYSLTDVTIGNSVTTIGKLAFSGCSGLTSVTIPNSVTTIDDQVFWYCRGLTSVTIGNSVTTIGYGAFAGCSGLTSITIPNSITTIGDQVFRDCSSLTSINADFANTQYSSENGVLFDKSKTTLVCYPAGKAGSYIIPSSVTTIDRYAFGSCSGLTTVTIPSSVTTIGNGAFWYCDGLTTVTNLSVTPQNINSNVFRDVNISACTLKVPASAVNAYKAAPVWSEFGNIIANE